MSGAEIGIILFCLFCICKGKIQSGGQGMHPDEIRRRHMEQLREEREGRERGWGGE